MIIKNNKTIESVYKGTTEIESIYKGTSLVYESWKTLTISSVPPIILQKCKYAPMLDYKIYGNTIQNGTPINELSNPVDYYSVGDEFSKSEIPSIYMELEYIESSGTQYIDTGIIPTTANGINIDYSYNNISADDNAGVCGIYQGTSPRTDTLFITTSSGRTNSTIALFQRGRSLNTDIIPVANEKFNAKINWLNDGKFDLNDGVATGTIGNNAVVKRSIILFGRDYNSNYALASARIYSCQISDEDDIIRDFIPAQRKSDGEIGLYDKVNDVFYTNQGTGTFAKGNALEVKYRIPIIVSGKNMFDKTNGVDNGHFIVASSGELSSESGTGALSTYACTYPIPVEPNTTYVKSGEIGAGTTRFEDADHNNIGHGSYPTTFTTPIGCAYVLFNLNRENAPYDDVQLEKGDTPTSYASYVTPTRTEIILDEPLRKAVGQNPVKLPDDYAQLEFIESTGTQYIDTGLKLNQDSRVKIKYQYKDDTTSARVFGDAHSSGNGWVLSTAQGNITSNIQSLYGSAWHPLPTESPLVIPSTNIVEYERNGRYQYVNGSIYYTNTTKTFETTNNVTVFGAYSGGALGIAKVRIYSLQIWQDGTTLSRNFVPCYRKSDGVNGLYDIVNDVFYENAGTGDFIKGQPIYADYIDFENQKVVRNFEELVITGNENGWETQGNSSQRLYRFKFNNAKVVPSDDDVSPLTPEDYSICNYFVCDRISASSTTKGASVYYSDSLGGTIFRCRTVTVYSSITNFTDALKQLNNNGNPLRFVYPLYVAKEESIELPSILLNKGYNIIEIDTTVIPSNMYIKYKGRQ